MGPKRWRPNKGCEVLRGRGRDVCPPRPKAPEDKEVWRVFDNKNGVREELIRLVQ